MRLLRSDHVAGWLFVAPATILLVVFGLVPIGWSAVLSFQHNDLLSASHWVGAANYEALRHDPVFRKSIRNTVVYTVLFVPISIGLALGVAMALNVRIRLISIYRTAVFVPVAVSTVATAIIFNWVFDPTYGIANWLLNEVGISSQGFFRDPDQALYGIVAMTVWGWIGFDVIIYLAALQGIPQELLEAAAIDGASRWATFRSVVLPLLGPATLFLIVWSTINALQLFDEIYNTTRGGPLEATTVVVYYLWQQAFQFFNAGYAAAIAYVLFVAILVVTLLQLLISRRTVHYTS
jgi:multiple sugar transport system permease protein